ncbi:MAG: hypothetical protein ACK40V_10970, partial [Anaerolineales bacterium]
GAAVGLNFMAHQSKTLNFGIQFQHQFSIRVAELARAQAKVADLYLYDGDNHNIASSFYTAMGRSIDFFDIYLKDTD